MPFDIDSFRAWAAEDDVLGPVVAGLAGFRPPLNPEPFEALVVAITTQQISLLAAAAIRSRFIERFGVKHDVAWEFPSRERIASADLADFEGVGFSQSKIAYVLGLARSELDLDALALLPDDEVAAAVTSLPGLGEWTADWFLARHLARPNAWPAGDLGLRKAVAAFYADGRPLSIKEVRSMGERFAPFQNLSAQFLLMGEARRVNERSPSARVGGGNHVSPACRDGVRGADSSAKALPPSSRERGEPPGSPHPSTRSWANRGWPMNFAEPRPTTSTRSRSSGRSSTTRSRRRHTRGRLITTRSSRRSPRSSPRRPRSWRSTTTAPPSALRSPGGVRPGSGR